MTTRNPLSLVGLWHLALKVKDLAQARAFYQNILGMEVVWEPDADNIYLSLGRDNLALHQIPDGETFRQDKMDPLDHFGFIVANKEGVDQTATKMTQAGVPIVKPVRLHRDGSYSFYIKDPDGNLIQILYAPHLVL
ncbi:MAG: VOC family protein [Nitrospirae bacterium]|nr:VOC family protein [Candidatus Troglogloeales bacterium]